MRQLSRLAPFLVAAMACPGAIAADNLLWIEGEAPSSARIEANVGPGSMSDCNPDELSGGKWICAWAHEGKPDNLVTYAVDIPADGKWRLWLRAAGGTGLSYRSDGGGWATVDLKKGTGSQIVNPGGWGMWPPPVAWFDLGDIDLKAGRHTIEYLLGGSAGKDRYAAIDCFVLTTATFTPHGKCKPGEADPGPQTFCPGRTWDFNPAADTLDPASQIDLRYLNEKTAGEHGFIKLSADGNSLVRGDGQPIRFWATSGGDLGEDLKSTEHDAQAMAKRGVNLVRIFGKIDPKKPGAKLTDVDESQVDGIFKEVAAFKSAGIYCTISPIWGFTTQPSWHVNPGGDQGTELLYFDKTVQTGYRAWMKELLTRVNPYTGMRLADDPAVVVVEVQNEESILSWSISGVSGPDLALLRSLYADFLKKKYGSLEKARAAWKDYNPPGNELTYHPDWEKGIPPFLHVWDFTHDGYVKKSPWPGFVECSSDQLEFLANLERGFNGEITRYLKTELGCKSLINTSNWKPADIAVMQDTENWSNSAGDVIAFHDYFGGLHTGCQAGWRFNVGDYYTDVSATKAPLQMPTNHKLVEGHPYMVTEMSWTPPDLYQSEGPLMLAGQMSLNGMSACFWQCVGTHGWDSGSAYKWSYNTPMLLGQFPAAALIYRAGMLRASAPVVEEHRRLEDLWARKVPLLCEGSGYDPNHPTESTSALVKTAVNPLALLIGPVRVSCDGHPEASRIADLSKDIDLDAKIVRSSTGEIATNYGVGLYTVNAPSAQGVAGFLKAAGPQQLADVTIACRNDYATIVAVALDGRPLQSAQRVLIQAGTTSRPTGWTVRPTRVQGQPAFEVISYGKPPAQVEVTDATVTVGNPGLDRATALDINGMPMADPVQFTQAGGKASVVLPSNTLYVLLSHG